MKIYQSFAESLSTFLGDDKAVRLTVDGFMPLSVEDIGTDAEGHRLIAMSHTGEQNGDLMRDPEMGFAIYDCDMSLAAELISFRNDYLGIIREVYRYDDAGKTHSRGPCAQARLEGFCAHLVEQFTCTGLLGPTRQQGTARLSRCVPLYGGIFRKPL